MRLVPPEVEAPAAVAQEQAVQKARARLGVLRERSDRVSTPSPRRNDEKREGEARRAETAKLAAHREEAKQKGYHWSNHVNASWIGRGVAAIIAVILLTWAVRSYFFERDSLRMKLISLEESVAGTPLDGPLGMRMRYVPSGTYTIGSQENEAGRFVDETRHEVRFIRGFWLAETELTQGQWSQLTSLHPS